MLTKEAYNLIKMIIANKYEQISRFLNERTTRLWVATESQAYGYGGIKLVYEATGIAASTIRRGKSNTPPQAAGYIESKNFYRTKFRSKLRGIYPKRLKS